MIPSILLRGQEKMDLKPDESNVLLLLISHSWAAVPYVGELNRPGIAGGPNS
jgi:hypothetical protein